MAKSKKMTDAELIAACEGKVRDASMFSNDRLSVERAESMDYYLGRPFGNEVEGQSQVVTRDVAEAVDSLLPELIEIFVASDEPGAFNPTGVEDVEAARQATDYVLWVWKQRGGLMLLYQWLKDGLLNKRGIIRIDWEDKEERIPENYEGLLPDEADLLASDADIEIAEITEREDGLKDVRAWRVNKTGHVTFTPVPPEEFMIDSNAVDEWEAPFIGQRAKKTATELIEMGFPEDVVADLATHTEDDIEMSDERIKRFSDEAGGGTLAREEVDESTREIWVNDVFIRIDYDGDGKSEYRHVLYAGEYVHENDETNDHPFATWCPFPIPHKFWGQGVADQAKDIQLIKSTIMRQVLQNLYLSNNPEKEVVEGGANLEDLLISRPGGIKRVRAPGMINNFEYPFVAGQSLPIIELLDQNLERRTGAFRYNQGLDPNSINKTATGITRLMDAGQRRVRLMARIFAETGFKRLFQRTLELLVKHQKVEKIIELRGTYVPMDPRNWRTNRDITINVGVGTGNKQEVAAQIMSLMEIDAGLLKMQGGLGGPLLKASNVYNKLRRLVETIGLKPAELFYSAPTAEDDQPKPPPPDPEMVKAQTDAQIKQMEAQQKAEIAKQQLQMDMAKMQADLTMKREEMQAKLQIAREEAMLKLQLMREEHMLEMQIRKEQAALEAEQEQVELAADIALKDKKIEMQGEGGTNVRDPDNKSKEGD